MGRGGGEGGGGPGKVVKGVPTTDYAVEYTTTPRLEMAIFSSTFSDDGIFGRAWWRWGCVRPPPFTLSTISTRVAAPPPHSPAKLARDSYLHSPYCPSPFLWFPLTDSPTEYNRVATATFWRTFYHDGKISPGWWGKGVHVHPLSIYLPSRTKLWCTL